MVRQSRLSESGLWHRLRPKKAVLGVPVFGPPVVGAEPEVLSFSNIDLHDDVLATPARQLL